MNRYHFICVENNIKPEQYEASKGTHASDECGNTIMYVSRPTCLPTASFYVYVLSVSL